MTLNPFEFKHAGLKITPDNPVPESKEPQLLDQAATLISRALSMAKGEPVDQGPAGGATGAGGKAEKGKAGAKAGAGKKAADKGGSRPTSPSRSPASPSGPGEGRGGDGVGKACGGGGDCVNHASLSGPGGRQGEVEGTMVPDH